MEVTYKEVYCKGININAQNSKRSGTKSNNKQGTLRVVLTVLYLRTMFKNGA